MQVSRRRSRPKLVLLISLGLGVLAASQVLLIMMLQLFGRTLPALNSRASAFSAIDQIAICGLAIVLIVSMKNLFQLRERAVSWFSGYLGLGAWAAFLYSLSENPGPHFNELASLAGLVVSLLVFAYLCKLRRDEILR